MIQSIQLKFLHYIKYSHYEQYWLEHGVVASWCKATPCDYLSCIWNTFILLLGATNNITNGIYLTVGNPMRTFWFTSTWWCTTFFRLKFNEKYSKQRVTETLIFWKIRNFRSDFFFWLFFLFFLSFTIPTVNMRKRIITKIFFWKKKKKRFWINLLLPGHFSPMPPNHSTFVFFDRTL